MPSLEGANAWLSRAEEHLADIRILCDALAETECDSMMASIRFNSQPGEPPSYAYSRPTSPVPSRVSVLVGEAIQAMRRSLDYLVYELAFVDSGREQEDTQFPIDESPKRFWRRLKRKRLGDHSCFLIGVKVKHAAAIERCQPYKGVDWTKTLNTLSNPDKHRYLTMAKSESKSTITWARARNATDHLVTRVAPDAFTFLLDVDPSMPNDMYMKFHTSAFISFESRLRVVDTLDQLKAEVGDVLKDFAPCFVSQCRHWPP